MTEGRTPEEAGSDVALARESLMGLGARIWTTHLRTVVWLVWRLWQRQEQLYRELGALAAALAVMAGCLLFVLALVLGIAYFPQAKPDAVMIAWTWLIAVFVFIRVIDALRRLQQGDGLPLDNLLHLPFSLHQAFLLNFAAPAGVRLMARLMDVADAAARTIGGWFPRGADGLRKSAVHPGQFTRPELDRLSSETPAVHVAFVRTHSNENVGAEDYRGDGADRVAEVIAAELARRIPEERWGVEGILRGAERVEVVNRFDAALADRHLALWTVSWPQTIRLGSPWPEGETPTTLCVSIDGVDEILTEETP